MLEIVWNVRRELVVFVEGFCIYVIDLCNILMLVKFLILFGRFFVGKRNCYIYIVSLINIR